MKPHLIVAALIIGSSVAGSAPAAGDSSKPIVPPGLRFEEVDGVLAVEAEHFNKQTATETRVWHIICASSQPRLSPDPDPPHFAGASGGACLEILPDTRRSDKDKLIAGENFSDKPGQMAVLHYNVRFTHPGRYYVWVRAFSTGSEDNGVHVGLDGKWPESGQRWQTVQKQAWAWDCKQRTPEVHTGVPFQLFLDIETPGDHEIMFSLREDGFEMDKFVLAKDKDYKPEGVGPSPRSVPGTGGAPQSLK
jgi:hypothetical protein